MGLKRQSVFTQAETKKIFDIYFFHFYCWQGIRVHNSCHRWDRTVLFSAFIIVVYSVHNQTKTKIISDKIAAAKFPLT